MGNPIQEAGLFFNFTCWRGEPLEVADAETCGDLLNGLVGDSPFLQTCLHIPSLHACFGHIKLASLRRHQFFDNCADREGQTVEGHDVSHDGQWLAYDSDLEGNQDIYLMPLDGGEPQRLTADSADDYAPTFSPDGREIAFYSNRHGTRDVFQTADP